MRYSSQLFQTSNENAREYRNTSSFCSKSLWNHHNNITVYPSVLHYACSRYSVTMNPTFTKASVCMFAWEDHCDKCSKIITILLMCSGDLTFLCWHLKQPNVVIKVYSNFKKYKINLYSKWRDFKLTFSNFNFTIARFLKSLLMEMLQEFIKFFLQMVKSTFCPTSLLYLFMFCNGVLFLTTQVLN